MKEILGAAAILGLIAVPSVVVAGNASQAGSPPRSFGYQDSCVLDATSSCTKVHGLGTKPDTVLVQETGPGQNAVVTAVTENTYRVKFNWHDGRTFKAGTVLKYYVHFDAPGGAPEPSPTPQPTPTVETPKYTTSVPNGSWMTAAPDTQVNNNVWSGDGGPQTLTAFSWNRWSVVSNQPGSGTDDGVKSYPDTQKHVTLPVASLTTLPSSWKVATPSAGGVVPESGKQWNAAYDLWLGDTADANWDTEVMVWTNWTANWQYWYGELGGEQVTIDGVAYHAYHRAGDSENARGIWFIRDQVTNEGSVDLAKLLKWAMSHQDPAFPNDPTKRVSWMPASSVLREIEYGFEVMYTGEPTRFDLLDFQVG